MASTVDVGKGNASIGRKLFDESRKLVEASAVDFGKRSEDYERFRPGFPSSFYARLNTFLALSNAHILDLGTGTGVAAVELAKRGAVVVGLDISANQIEYAKRKAANELGEGAPRCQFDVAPAEATNQPDNYFDMVFVGTAWHWFDCRKALDEVYRILKPGGLLVIAYYVYLSRESAIAGDSEQLVLQFNPNWNLHGLNGTFPELLDVLTSRQGLGGGRFVLVEQFCYDHDQPFTHEGWRGRMRSCNGVGSGTLDDSTVEKFDTALKELLATKYPTEPLLIKHRVWAIVARKVAQTI